uniref:Uncharacterized protein n=1 Tax=Physcomitrium patens TaxID=3218 RepID=A0A2K1IBP3_PHYPA|nr:hypothetical protein PHYPA_030167 [Physcomitrium patens]
MNTSALATFHVSEQGIRAERGIHTSWISGGLD